MHSSEAKVVVFSSVSFWTKFDTQKLVRTRLRTYAHQSKPIISETGGIFCSFQILSVGGLSHWNFPLYNIKYLYSNIICINFITKITEYYLIKKYQLFKTYTSSSAIFSQCIFGGQNANKEYPNGIGAGYQTHERNPSAETWVQGRDEKNQGFGSTIEGIFCN